MSRFYHLPLLLLCEPTFCRETFNIQAKTDVLYLMLTAMPQADIVNQHPAVKERKQVPGQSYALNKGQKARRRAKSAISALFLYSRIILRYLDGKLAKQSQPNKNCQILTLSCIEDAPGKLLPSRRCSQHSSPRHPANVQHLNRILG